MLSRVTSRAVSAFAPSSPSPSKGLQVSVGRCKVPSTVTASLRRAEDGHEVLPLSAGRPAVLTKRRGVEERARGVRVSSSTCFMAETASICRQSGGCSRSGGGETPVLARSPSGGRACRKAAPQVGRITARRRACAASSTTSFT